MCTLYNVVYKSTVLYTVRTQSMAIGLNLYLGSQSICFVRIWVSYCEWSYAWQPEYTPVYSDPSFYLIELLSLRVTAHFSQPSL